MERRPSEMQNKIKGFEILRIFLPLIINSIIYTEWAWNGEETWHNQGLGLGDDRCVSFNII